MRHLAPFILPLLLAGCGGGPDAQTTLTLTQAPAAFGPEARVVVKLWGYDRGLADASATRIASWQLPIESSGVIELDVPEEPHTLIDQGNGPVAAADAGFYFNVHVDLDGDGQLCPGDLRQDYDAAEPEFFTAVPASLTVPLTAIETGRACESIQP